ncbi:MAG: hypothetical protein QOD63_64 [Actinomycetota bacterium]|nr:hypothetical protein [Actinomycetota bacterium]
MSAWSRRRLDEDPAERELRLEIESLRRERADLIALARASRAAHDRAMAEPLTDVERRVFDAVRFFTVDWHKWSDEVYLSQLGAHAGIGGTTKSQATEAGRAVRRLAELGIIEYEPHRGRGMPSRVGIPRVVLRAVKGENRTLLLAPEESQEKESPEPEKESESAEKESPCNSPTRRDPEDLSRNSSSSSDDPIDAGAEEEDADSVRRACRLVAERRLAVRTGDPVTNRDRWLAAVAADVRPVLAGMDLRGLSAQAIADRVQPRPGSPHAPFDDRRAPAWTELEDGSVVPAGLFDG